MDIEVVIQLCLVFAENISDLEWYVTYANG